jgi:glyoxylase-like metal-dependent hydrolase (beta-lactamase superfamily II)
MIAKLILLILFFPLLSIATAFPESLENNLSISEVKPDLFVVVHSYPWSSNSLVAVMADREILLVDTPYTPEATDSVLNWIDKKFGKRKITAINTHFHIDRLGGNAALVKRTIPIYSSELTVDAIKTRGKRSLDLMISWSNDDSIKKYFQNFIYIAPTKIFYSQKGLTLNFGKEKVDVRFLGVGHSIDNLVVYLPMKKVIFGGCMILSLDAKNAGNVSDGNIHEWKKVMEAINTKNYDLVIPGHGKMGGLELITHTEEILKK